MPAETTVSGAHPAAKLPIYILPCFLWIGIVPFTFALKLKPSPDFYHDAAAAAGLIVLLFLTAGKKLFDVKIPAISFLLFAMAAFWYLQARLMNLIYPGMNDIVSWIFILLAVSAWACKSLVAHFGQERIVTLFAWSLLIGSLLQSCIVVIQFAGWEETPLLQNIIVYSGQGVIGHIGQRNNLGHYLMWGILAAAYLNGQRKIPAALGAICLIMQTAVLGLVNSRTILTYIAAIALILPFWYFRSDKSNRRTMLGIAAAVFLTALFQFSMNTILETFTGIRYETAVERVANGGFTDLPRQTEWRKALAAFQSAPIFGHGWNSFAQQTFLINAEQHNIHDNLLSNLFTHSHNIVLQLLAEMGISGTLLVAATLLTGIAGLLKRPLTPASLFLICTLAVSMCHSMLEYPLWYVYFLIPFGLMLFLSPAEASDGIAFKKAANLGILTASAAIFAGLLHLDWTYTRLVNAFSPATDDSTKTLNRKINELYFRKQSDAVLLCRLLPRKLRPAGIPRNPDLGGRSNPQITKIPPPLRHLPHRPLPDAARQSCRSKTMDAGDTVLLPLPDAPIRRRNPQTARMGTAATRTAQRLQSLRRRARSSGSKTLQMTRAGGCGYRPKCKAPCKTLQKTANR